MSYHIERNRVGWHGTGWDGEAGGSTDILVNDSRESSALWAGLGLRTRESGVVCTWRSAGVPVSIASWNPAEAATGIAYVACAERSK